MWYSFMNFHFIFSIDATKDTGRYGRLVNHSKKAPNLVTKVIMNGESPRLILIAKHDIEAGVELVYDYGDRSKKSLLLFPWLKN
jgi:histone-lysine N-methyltransferase SETD8